MPTILIVDDDDGIRQVLVRALAREGFEILDAPNGRVALALMGQATPDLVVTDLSMPQLNGTLLVRAMAAEPALAHVRVLLMTGEDCTTAPVGYPLIEKPFSLRLLLDTVRHMLL